MPNVRSSALMANHEAPYRNEEPLLTDEMVKITVPKETSKRLPLKRAVRLTKKAAKKWQPLFAFNRSTTVWSARVVYWPYWIGKIQTEKDRPLFGPRRIAYFTIGDAVAGGHLVVRAIPDFAVHMVASHLLVPFERNVDAFYRELAIVQKEKIPKLFIFGAPRQQVEMVQLIYCPHWEVSLRRQEEQALSKIAYVNAFNGSVRAC